MPSECIKIEVLEEKHKRKETEMTTPNTLTTEQEIREAAKGLDISPEALTSLIDALGVNDRPISTGTYQWSPIWVSYNEQDAEFWAHVG